MGKTAAMLAATGRAGLTWRGAGTAVQSLGFDSRQQASRRTGVAAAGSWGGKYKKKVGRGQQGYDGGTSTGAGAR